MFCTLLSYATDNKHNKFKSKPSANDLNRIQWSLNNPTNRWKKNNVYTFQLEPKSKVIRISNDDPIVVFIISSRRSDRYKDNEWRNKTLCKSSFVKNHCASQLVLGACIFGWLWIMLTRRKSLFLSSFRVLWLITAVIPGNDNERKLIIGAQLLSHIKQEKNFV